MIQLPADGSDKLKLTWMQCGFDEKPEKRDNVFKDRPYIREEQSYLHAKFNLKTLRTTVKNKRKIDILSTAKSVNGNEVLDTKDEKILPTNMAFDGLNKGYWGKQWRGELFISNIQEFITVEGKKATRYSDVETADLRYAFNKLCQDNDTYYPGAKNPYVILDDTCWVLGYSAWCKYHLENNNAGTEDRMFSEVYFRNAVYDTNSLDDFGPSGIVPSCQKHHLFLTTRGKKLNISEISREMGMALLLSEPQCGDSKCPGLGDVGVIKTLVDTIDNHPDFGLIKPIHSFLAVRWDEEDITLNQVNAFLAYACQSIQKMLPVRDGCEARRQRFVEAWFSHSTKFERFFEAYRQEELRLGRMEWKDEKPPRRVGLHENLEETQPGPYGFKD